MKNVRGWFGQVCVLLGCVIGSGFVGGRELLLTFKAGSVLSVGLFVILLCVFLFFIINFCVKRQIVGFDSFNTLVFGRFNNVWQFLLLICYFVITATLLAGTNACLMQIFQLNTQAPIFSFLAAIVAFLIMLKGIDGIKKFSVIALPFVLIYLAVVHFANVDKIAISFLPVEGMSALSYALFNVVAAIGVVSSTSGKMKKKSVPAVIVAFGVVLFLTATVQLSILNKPQYKGLGVPLFAIVQSNAVLYWAGCIAVVFASVAAVLSNVLPIVEYVNSFVCDFSLSVAIVFFLALLLSILGMDFLVKYIFPFISLFGVIVIVAMAILTAKKPLQFATA